MSRMWDPITNTEVEVQPVVPMFLVTPFGSNEAFSIHRSRAAARAEIRWRWSRQYPELGFDIQELL